MAIIKCKMCGGDLEILEDSTVCECAYCGTRQTVPSADNEKKLTLFARAGRFLRECEFDKAAGVYESIIADFDQEAEAYWGLILCRYGIEYVDDPATGKKVPTCHRSSFESVMDDADFERVMDFADPIARRVYRDEAKAIEELRKDILAVSSKEEPYDVFISYKEKADNGERTVDSVIAQDIYKALTDEGFRVFFSRISLEDKLGTEYEPYIFAALNSAKVMLVVGTDYDHFNAVWVKNEWSRFLKLIAKGNKKTLIPVFRDVDAYDMPKEFRHLTAQDMGKVGAMQDLVRGVEKILGKKQAEPAVAQQVVVAGGPNVTAMLDRGRLALEDGEWDKARAYFDQALNMDAKCADAYLGFALGELKLKHEAALAKLPEGRKVVDTNASFQKFLRFASGERLQQILALLEMAQAEKQKREDAARAEKKALAALRQEREEAQRRLAAEQRQHRMEEAEARSVFREEQPALRKRIAPAQGIIAAGGQHVAAVTEDGKILVAGKNDSGQCDVSDWNDIISVAVSGGCTIGLKTDGSLLAVGEDPYKQCDVSQWKNIAVVAASGGHTVGLQYGGKVMAVGKNDCGQCNVTDGEWENITAVAVSDHHTVGLRSDGAVIAVGKNDRGQCNVSEWRSIVAIAANNANTIGLLNDGGVLAAGDAIAVRGVQRWKEIVAISASDSYVVGLKADGTVEVCTITGGHFSFADWNDIVAVAACKSFVIGLRADGTIKTAGIMIADRKTIAGWKLFDSLESLVAKRQTAVEREKTREKKKKLEQVTSELDEIRAEQESLQKEKTALEQEMNSLKGLFTGKRRKEIEVKLNEIEKNLKEVLIRQSKQLQKQADFKIQYEQAKSKLEAFDAEKGE